MASLLGKALDKSVGAITKVGTKVGQGVKTVGSGVKKVATGAAFRSADPEQNDNDTPALLLNP